MLDPDPGHVDVACASVEVDAMAAALRSRTPKPALLTQEIVSPLSLLPKVTASSRLLPKRRAVSKSRLPFAKNEKTDIFPMSFEAGTVLPQPSSLKIPAFREAPGGVLGGKGKVDFSQDFCPSSESSSGAFATPTRPVTFAPALDYNMVSPEIELIRSYYMNRTPSLFFASNPTDQASSCVGVVIDGAKWVVDRTLFDGGSNGFLMTDKVADSLGVQVFPAEVVLNTSNGPTRVLGTTLPIPISYGAGCTEIITHHCFLVVPASVTGCYDLLLGNTDVLHYGGIHDMGRGVLEMFPAWPEHGRDDFTTAIRIEARPPRAG
jgi:hypothetical protein